MALFGRTCIWRATFLSATIVLLGIVFYLTLIKPPAPVDRLQSIEEYRTALRQPDFGMFFVDFSSARRRPTRIASIADVRLLVSDTLGLQDTRLGLIRDVQDLTAAYSAIAGKRVCFGQSWRMVTNTVSYDDNKAKTRYKALRAIGSILRTNGAYIVPLNATCVVLLTTKDLNELGQYPARTR